MQSSSSQSLAAACYVPAPYISGFMARQDFDRLFGLRPAEVRAIADNRKIFFIYTLAAMTVFCSVFWVAFFKIIF